MSCFNAQRWLAQAIDSVLAQTYRDYELILVDDGSTDGTGIILGQYTQQDDRIRVVHKKNTGLADSLNSGIAMARGDWIARLDADDLCEERRLAEQIEFLDRHPRVVLLGSGFLEIDENDREVARHRRPTGHPKLVRHLERLQRFFPHSSAVFKRSLSEELRGYNTRFEKTQDWDLWLRLSERGEIACLRRALVRIRTHPNRITNAPTGRAQIVYGAAAVVSHFLRINGEKDPSESTEEEWSDFIAWVQERMIEEGVLQRRGEWAAARDKYLRPASRVQGLACFAFAILRSGNALNLVGERLFAFSFPRRLARDWAVFASRRSGLGSKVGILGRAEALDGQPIADNTV